MNANQTLGQIETVGEALREARFAAPSGSAYTVGDIVRLKHGHGFRVWKITGIHLGGLGHENLVSLKPLETSSGSAFGVGVPETVMPLELLTTHPHVERV